MTVTTHMTVAMTMLTIIRCSLSIATILITVPRGRGKQNNWDGGDG